MVSAVFSDLHRFNCYDLTFSCECGIPSNFSLEVDKNDDSGSSPTNSKIGLSFHPGFIGTCPPVPLPYSKWSREEPTSPLALYSVSPLPSDPCLSLVPGRIEPRLISRGRLEVADRRAATDFSGSLGSFPSPVGTSVRPEWCRY